MLKANKLLLYKKSLSMFNATCDKRRCIKLSKECNYNLINVKVQSPSLMRLFHLPLFLFNMSLPCRFYVIQGRAKVFPAIQHHTNASALEGFSIMWSAVKRPSKALDALYLDLLVPRHNTATS